WLRRVEIRPLGRRADAAVVELTRPDVDADVLGRDVADVPLVRSAAPDPRTEDATLGNEVEIAHDRTRQAFVERLPARASVRRAEDADFRRGEHGVRLRRVDLQGIDADLAAVPVLHVLAHVSPVLAGVRR